VESGGLELISKLSRAAIKNYFLGSHLMFSVQEGSIIKVFRAHIRIENVEKLQA
jgi:hypothetical protein